MATEIEEIKKALQTEEPFMSVIQTLKTDSWGTAWDTRPFEKMRKHVSESLNQKYTANGTYLYSLELHFRELEKLNAFVAIL